MLAGLMLGAGMVGAWLGALEPAPEMPLAYLEVTGTPGQAFRGIIQTNGRARDVGGTVPADFPLGNGTGRPNDPASQTETLDLALALLESAPAPRTTVQSPLRWSDNPDWKLDYSNAARMSAEEIAVKRAEFDSQKAIATALREAEGLNRKKA